MDLHFGPSSIERYRSSGKSMKTYVFSDAELLDIIENYKWISSDE